MVEKFKNFVIRTATQTDLSALEWDGEYQHFRRVYASLFRTAQAGRAVMWVVDSPKNGIIGQAFVMLKRGDRDTPDVKKSAYVFSFRVKVKWRNHGIGKFLMEFIEEDLVQRGYQVVTLNVAKENQDALRLYERLGYRVIGSHAGIWSYKDDTGKTRNVHEPAWRMIKELEEAGNGEG